MRIAVMGAGAVGGYFGARLSASGHNAAFLARGAHLDALRREGLRVDSPGGNLHIQDALFTDDPGQVGVVDLILFCVKSYDTEETAAALTPMIEATATISCRCKTASTTPTRSRSDGEMSEPWPAWSISGRNSLRPGKIKHSSGGKIVFGELTAGP